MLFSNLTEENNTSETTVASSDATVKDKSKIIDVETMKKFKKDKKVVRGHLLNHMTNCLFDLFVTFKFAKIIWEKLEINCRVDDTGKKKYVIGECLRFQITDGKPIIEQVYVYENLCAEVLCENMMCEILQANVLIEKFSPSWSDYKNQLKYKKKILLCRN